VLTLLRSLTFLDFVGLLAAVLLLAMLIALVVGVIRRSGGFVEAFLWPLVGLVVAVAAIVYVGVDRTLGVVDPLMRALFAGQIT